MELTLITMLSKTKKVFTTHLPVLCSIASLRSILSITWKIGRLSLLFVPPTWRRNGDYYESKTIDDLKEKKALTLADTKYVLVEFAEGEAFSKIYRGVQDLQYAGYWPIIAHVERYEAVRKSLANAERLCDTGAFLQVNVENFEGGFFDSKASFVKKLMKRQMVHFIASDCHDTTNRIPLTNQQIQHIQGKYGEKSLQKILYENPKKVLEGKILDMR